MNTRIPNALLALLEPGAHLVYLFGIGALVAFTKFFLAIVLALVGFALLLRLRKWVRRVTGTAPGERNA